MRVAFLVALLFMLVQRCFGTVVATDDKLEAILARLDALETTVVEQRTMNDEQQSVIQQQNATIQQLHEDIDRQHFDNWGTKRSVMDVKVQPSNKRRGQIQQQRRALASASCAGPTGPRLLVDGVCSCSDDVLIGNRSVSQRIDDLNATLFATTEHLLNISEPVSLAFPQPTEVVVKIEGSYHEYVGNLYVFAQGNWFNAASFGSKSTSASGSFSKEWTGALFEPPSMIAISYSGRSDSNDNLKVSSLTVEAYGYTAKPYCSTTTIAEDGSDATLDDLLSVNGQCVVLDYSGSC